MPTRTSSEISLPKNAEIFIRIAAVFVSFTVVLAPLQDGDTFFEKVLHVLPWTVPIAVVVVACTIVFLRWRSKKAAPAREVAPATTPDVEYGEHPPLN